MKINCRFVFVFLSSLPSSPFHRASKGGERESWGGVVGGMGGGGGGGWEGVIVFFFSCRSLFPQDWVKEEGSQVWGGGSCLLPAISRRLGWGRGPLSPLPDLPEK